MKYMKTAAFAAGTLMALGTAAPAMADSGSEGATQGSPGIVSGNVTHAPVHIPVNGCGNTVDAIGLLNPASDSTCVAG